MGQFTGSSSADIAGSASAGAADPVAETIRAALAAADEISDRIHAGGYRSNLSDTETLRNHVRRLAAKLSNATSPSAVAEAVVGWRTQYFEQLKVADALTDRAVEAETQLHAPRTAVMQAAWALCDDTEGTVHQDEFGDHYWVPKESWDRLAKALEGVDPSEPAVIQNLRTTLIEANDAQRAAENRAQRLYEQNGADPCMLAALRALIAKWEGDDWVFAQEEMVTIARAAVAKAEGMGENRIAMLSPTTAGSAEGVKLDEARAVVRDLLAAWPDDSVPSGKLCVRAAAIVNGGPVPPHGEGVGKLVEALTEINAIRNSIIGCQCVNFSEHVYPLVAILNRVGFEGLDYAECRANVGTLIERTNAAEDRADRAEFLFSVALAAAEAAFDPSSGAPWWVKP